MRENEFKRRRALSRQVFKRVLSALERLAPVQHYRQSRSAFLRSKGRGSVTEFVPLRRNYQFQLLWVGNAVSQVGTELTKLVMPILVLALTQSSLLAGLVVGARVAAYVGMQLPAGVLTDRWDRRLTLLVSQGAQFLGAACMAVLVLSGEVRIWHLVVLGAIDGVCMAFTGPANTTAVRAIVPKPQLRTAYAQEEARGHTARLVGPPLGGLLYEVGRPIPFVVDAVSFLIAFTCSLFARVPRRPAAADRVASDAPADEAQAGMRQEAAEAFHWLWQRQGLRGVFFAVMAMNLLGGAVLIPLVTFVQERSGDALTTGTIYMGIGIGGLIGAVLSDRIGRMLPLGRLIIVLLMLFGVSNAAMTLPLTSWWPMIPLLVTAIFTPALNVGVNVMIARLVPEEMLGRVDAMLTLVTFGLAPLAPVFGGLLAEVLGGVWAIIVVGVAFLFVAAVAATSRELREFVDEQPAEEAAAKP
jgi:MFS family permease